MKIRECQYCHLEKPIEQFSSKRKCVECANHKICKICEERKHVNEFSQFHGKVCKTCIKTRNHRRYIENKVSILAKSKLWKKENQKRYRSQQDDYRRQKRAELKQQVLTHYGACCACCGEREILFLTIDHIHGNGGLHRRQIGKTDMWKWLAQNDYPDGFQILCYNCNVGRYRNGGVCPHKASTY